jgi:UPF0716 protein FxsA
LAIILFIALVATPMVEIAAFIVIGERIGLIPTLATVVLTAVAGTWLLRRQGFAVLRRVEQSMARQELPVAALFDGLCLLVAGLLLLTPGFVTDAIGLALFVPPLRRALQAAIWRYLRARGHIEAEAGFDDDGGGVVEGEYRVIDPPEPPDRPPPDRPPPDRPRI